jgi:uncharacterized RDD family membrane protein YckC
MKYANIFDRYKAAFVDGIILVFLFIIANFILSRLGNVSDNVNKLVFFSILIYEPVFVSFLGGTIGHFTQGLRVKNEKNESENMNFFNSLLRFVLKVLLGGISLFFVNNNPKKKAFHDLLAGSVVIIHHKVNENNF